MTQSQRRSFLKSVARYTAGTWTGIAGLGLASHSGPAWAKPGGHATAAHYCRSVLDVKGLGVFELTFGGTGYASFHNAGDYAKFNVREILMRDTVSMEWEVNHCYSNSSMLIGPVTARAQVRGKGDARSGNVLISNNPNGLFPATMVNYMYFEFSAPRHNLVMFNKDAMVMRGNVNAMDAAAVQKDPRVARNPKGLPSTVSGIGAYHFEPIGKHGMIKPVDFYDRKNPHKVVATLLSSTIETVPNYGIEIALVDAEAKGNLLNGVFEITNLTHKKHDIYWYVEDSRDLKLVGAQNEKREILYNKTIRVPFQAYNADPSQELGKESCLFCGAVGLTDDFEDFVSGFRYTDGTHYKKIA